VIRDIIGVASHKPPRYRFLGSFDSAWRGTY
jgi:hypothetical protein